MQEPPRKLFQNEFVKTRIIKNSIGFDSELEIPLKMVMKSIKEIADIVREEEIILQGNTV